MREIKFRCWDGEKMHRVIYYKGGKNCVVPIKRFPMQEEIIAEHVMQFTGLKDKNGKDIYEGDKTTLDEYVVFENGSFKTTYKEDTQGGGLLTEMRCKHLEIIGNIHE